MLEHIGAGQVDVRSAGSSPADQINPIVIEAMAEMGIDISTGVPKPLSEGAVRDADVVVTMGCGDACPVTPGTRSLDWDLPDPSGMPLREVRAIRDEIEVRVRALLEDLLH